MKTFTLTPRDLLFLRDARPMAASDAGLGANWPRPDQLWYALIHAFHRTWPERQAWEGAEHTKRLDALKRSGSASKRDSADSSDRFGALKSLGPLPYHTLERELYLPCPLDLDMELVSCTGTNLPAPLQYALRPIIVGKRELPSWLSAQQFIRYMQGAALLREASTNAPLYHTERNIGIAIDSDTQTTVAGQFYQAEYLRLAEHVTLALMASCDLHPKGSAPDAVVDVFEQLTLPLDLIIGGQQGVARMEALPVPLALPQVEINTQYLRWTLIAPALFVNGWLPGWINQDDGKVRLRQELPRQPGESRHAWRERLKSVPEIDARLIAACVGKPEAFSGWDLQTGPKPTQLAVPAGSSFYFDCGSIENAQKLAALLHGNTKSDALGEKGFGLGLCSSFTLNPTTT